ncbi:hypothetical protein DASC09_006690 [Saccharomycopsis crataegensis]|uniref:Uncharacterized protein n=1 Tax=Saccharomycopsis crataegensis TaxID=43959 RepID=A0AAV5QG54_9ASCO|nr:hypothetical protein DASC09_006690 [Saccharomycopsis crataegensis]
MIGKKLITTSAARMPTITRLSSVMEIKRRKKTFAMSRSHHDPHTKGSENLEYIYEKVHDDLNLV